MDLTAPITSIVNFILTPFNTIVAMGATAISDLVTPVVGAVFILYVLLKMIAMLKGMDESSVIDFGLFLLSFFLVFAMMKNYDNYNTYVVTMVDSIKNGLSSALTGSTLGANSLDTLAIYYIDMIDKGQQAIDAMLNPLNRIGAQMSFVLKELMILLGLVPFLVAATITITVLEIGLRMVLAIGPLFIAFGLFPNTRQYASAFVNTVFSYVLGITLVSVVALASVGISMQMLSSGGGTLNEASVPAVFYASIGNLILLFLLKQVSSVASSLSAGGINAGMAGGSITGAAKGASGAFARHRNADGSKGKGLAIGSQSVDAGKALAKMLKKGNSITKH